MQPILLSADGALEGLGKRTLSFVLPTFWTTTTLDRNLDNFYNFMVMLVFARVPIRS
jgi:hypothetical protein